MHYKCFQRLLWLEFSTQKYQLNTETTFQRFSKLVSCI